MSSTLKTCRHYPRQRRQNRKAFHLKHEKFCPTKRVHLCTSIAEILQNYMIRSEQLETRLWLAADDRHAGCMLLQKLPNRPEQDADAWNRASQLADTLKQDELLKLPAETILHRLFHEEDIRLFDPQPISFHCRCSREGVANMLRMLGRGEVNRSE